MPDLCELGVLGGVKKPRLKLPLEGTSCRATACAVAGAASTPVDARLQALEGRFQSLKDNSLNSYKKTTGG